MGYEWAHSGSVRLKEGVTLEDVLNLFSYDVEPPRLPLRQSGEVELEDGDVWIKVEPGELVYRASGDRRVLDEQVVTFLDEVATEVAAAGWADYELDDHEVFYGPSGLACAEARAATARLALAAAETELMAAETELRRLQQA